MKSRIVISLSLLYIGIVSTGAQPVTAAGYADPCFPDEIEYSSAATRKRGVRSLAKQQQDLLQQLEKFPPLESRITPPHQRFGYLSERHPVSETNGSMNAWVQLSFFGEWTPAVDGIALVPAYYPEYSAENNYGFPKRFKIEVFSHQAPDDPVVVVDWTGEDFPDPGLYPVLFSFPAQDVQTVRLTVTKGAQEDDSQFFALNELMVFQMGNNVAPPAYQGLKASGSYDEPPYWKLQYLTDRKIHTGSFSHTYGSVPDFIQYFESEALGEQPVELLLDLGADRNVGRVELYPAKVHGMPIPEFGFPLKYEVELKRLNMTNPVAGAQPGEDAMSSGMRWHPMSGARGRILRFIFHNLPLHNGQPVLALGEIRVVGRQVEHQVNFAAGKEIKLTPVPNGEMADCSLLTDGYSNGRKIIQERLYIEQLAERKIVEQNRADIEQRLTIAHATRKQIFWMIGIAAGLCLFFVLVFWIMFQRAARQRALFDLRQQIAADLHDDISSNLGTISMITTRLQQDSDPSLLKKKLGEISHIAQESFVSVKEIIWHMDSDIVHFSELFEKIQKTAMLILTDTRISCDLQKDCGVIEVPARTRRNIMLLVKEALYNCAKYAKARNMEIHADIRNYILVLTMQDDGCGFDSACAKVAKSESGRGMSNMERRARLLGGELEIQSEPGKGTLLTLRMPLK
ncbi:ATP-binding protein [Pontiellaceae bacterium B1224]|nr:ATP-binding protein [Pontiellaceae bacterium B1224]